MKKLTSLSIFFPAFNDEETIQELVEKAYKVGAHIAKDLEVIVIDDGSSDLTGKKLQLLKKNHRDLIIVTHKKNQGYGATLRDGFASATKEWVFYTDGDGQYDPEELTKLINSLLANVDVVNGYKSERADSMLRTIIGKIYNKILQKIYQLPISDIDCDFRLIRRSLLQKTNLHSDTGMICLELIVSLRDHGARFAETGVSHYQRKFGRSQFFTFFNLKKTFVDHLFFYLQYKRGTI